MRPTASRRTVLKRSGAVVGAIGLAGCSGGGGGRRTVEVGPGHRLEFDPAAVRIQPGTTVRWVWRSDDHNLVPDEVPDDADWGGTPGDADVTYGPGYTYEETFEVAGRYRYHCEPHLSAGMTGAVVVEQ